MKTIWLAALAVAGLWATEARAQQAYYYTPPFQKFGNYAPTMYANSGRPSARAAAQYRYYRAMRPVMAPQVTGEYAVAPEYALPGTFRYYPRVTTSYYRAPAPVNAGVGTFGYDYQLRPPADYYGGYWGW